MAGPRAYWRGSDNMFHPIMPLVKGETLTAYLAENGVVSDKVIDGLMKTR